MSDTNPEKTTKHWYFLTNRPPAATPEVPRAKAEVAALWVGAETEPAEWPGYVWLRDLAGKRFALAHVDEVLEISEQEANQFRAELNEIKQSPCN